MNPWILTLLKSYNYGIIDAVVSRSLLQKGLSSKLGNLVTGAWRGARGAQCLGCQATAGARTIKKFYKKFFNSANLLLKDLRFGQRVRKACSLPRRHLTSVRPCLVTPNFIKFRTCSTHFVIRAIVSLFVALIYHTYFMKLFSFIDLKERGKSNNRIHLRSTSTFKSGC